MCRSAALSLKRPKRNEGVMADMMKNRIRSWAMRMSVVAMIVPLLGVLGAMIAIVAHMKGWGSRVENFFGLMWGGCVFTSLPLALIAAIITGIALRTTKFGVFLFLAFIFDCLVVLVGFFMIRMGMGW